MVASYLCTECHAHFSCRTYKVCALVFSVFKDSFNKHVPGYGDIIPEVGFLASCLVLGMRRQHGFHCWMNRDVKALSSCLLGRQNLQAKEPGQWSGELNG